MKDLKVLGAKLNVNLNYKKKLFLAFVFSFLVFPLHIFVTYPLIYQFISQRTKEVQGFIGSAVFLITFWLMHYMAIKWWKFRIDHADDSRYIPTQNLEFLYYLYYLVIYATVAVIVFDPNVIVPQPYWQIVTIGMIRPVTAIAEHFKIIKKNRRKAAAMFLYISGGISFVFLAATLSMKMLWAIAMVVLYIIMFHNKKGVAKQEAI